LRLAKRELVSFSRVSVAYCRQGRRCSWIGFVMSMKYRESLDHE